MVWPHNYETNVKECEEESKALRLAVEASENKKKNELNMEQLKAQLESSQKKAIDLEKENNELIERLQRIEKDSKNVQIERDECLKKNENKTARLHKEGDAKAEVSDTNSEYLYWICLSSRTYNCSDIIIKGMKKDFQHKPLANFLVSLGR
ncbi:hypothetical protein Tcan_07463 [Toxocara canis]|uniref:Uncharacterized protein n=1 Tax=Toxocara canis TaxID=6265 RepID=A0A0B2VP77_TOXCA|nr:hypothetical protein Tcan_07463 [Toxocara canis]